MQKAGIFRDDRADENDMPSPLFLIQASENQQIYDLMTDRFEQVSEMSAVSFTAKSSTALETARAHFLKPHY